MTPDRTEPARDSHHEHPWDDEKVRGFREALLGFFRAEGRELPWRRDADPYRVLVSEVMLQQTRVETVIPYYRRWVERFPDAAALASAEPDEVLGLWEGLGYYSRARNLHRAVREVSARYGGEVPSDPVELRTLPGVGPYTAGAVASIAFGRAVPAVDGNVRRVLARLLDAAKPSAAELERWAGRLVDPERPGDFNQALMELGALVCTPRGPDCDGCPVAAWCAARAAGTQESRPAPVRRSPPPRVDEAVAVLVRERDGDGREVLLRKRPEEGLLAGLWEMPGTEPREGETPEAAARRLVGEVLGGPAPARAWALPPVDHAFSHRRMRYHPFVVRTEAASARRQGGGRRAGRTPPMGRPEGGSGPPGEFRWARLERLGDFALPAAQRRILDRFDPAALP